MNHRITLYFESESVLGEEQAGFREGYSTMDHAFVLKSLLDIYLSKGRRIYCAFVDFRKAFDMIDRASLWYKLLLSGVNGKVFRAIKNMYASAKSCVTTCGQTSETFACNIGVRQGDNLSPLLFAIYLNDFVGYIRTKFKGLQYLYDEVCSDVLDKITDEDLFINLHSLLYADDTIILAENPEELQMALDALSNYCEKWKLRVNNEKNKDNDIL